MGDPRLQGLLHRPAHCRRLQEHPGEGHRNHLPQGRPHHLAEPEAGAQRVRQRRAHLRQANKIGEYAELGNVSRDSVKADELEFQKVVEGRAKENGGKLKYLTIAKEEKEVEVKDLKTLSEVIEGLKADFPGLVHMRVPVCNSAAPNEADFDIICNTLVGTSINTPIIVNDQVGLSRATTGCVIACLFKEFQINASFEGLVETVPGVNLD